MAARSPLGPGPRYIRYHPLYYSLGLHSSFIIHGFIAHYIVSTIQVLLNFGLLLSITTITVKTYWI